MSHLNISKLAALISSLLLLLHSSLLRSPWSQSPSPHSSQGLVLSLPSECVWSLMPSYCAHCDHLTCPHPSLRWWSQSLPSLLSMQSVSRAAARMICVTLHLDQSPTSNPTLALRFIWSKSQSLYEALPDLGNTMTFLTISSPPPWYSFSSQAALPPLSWTHQERTLPLSLSPGCPLCLNSLLLGNVIPSVFAQMSVSWWGLLGLLVLSWRPCPASWLSLTLLHFFLWCVLHSHILCDVLLYYVPMCHQVECKLRDVYWCFFSSLSLEYCHHLVCAQ